MQDVKMNQAAIFLENAGKSYETSDILRYVSYGSLFLGSIISSVASLGGGGSNLQAAGGAFIAGSLGTGIASLVYRFRGHSNLKNAGSILKK
jgi:hypothetical protein